MRQRKHINALNAKAALEMLERGITLPPGVLEWLRRMKHRQDRLERYRRRNASYPYSSTRQNTRGLRRRLRDEAKMGMQA